jgi:hypothetical protein
VVTSLSYTSPIQNFSRNVEKLTCVYGRFKKPFFSVANTDFEGGDNDHGYGDYIFCSFIRNPAVLESQWTAGCKTPGEGAAAAGRTKLLLCCCRTQETPGASEDTRGNKEGHQRDRRTHGGSKRHHEDRRAQRGDREGHQEDRREQRGDRSSS